MDVNPLQLENASEPIDVTELGIVMDVKPLWEENALSPIDVTLRLTPNNVKLLTTRDGISTATASTEPITLQVLSSILSYFRVTPL